MNTTGVFNYRVDPRPEGDPVRAQGRSIARLVTLLTKFRDKRKTGESLDMAGSFSKNDASGTFDMKILQAIFAKILKSKDAREELQSIVRDQGRSVSTMLREERKDVANARVDNAVGLFTTGFQLYPHLSNVQNWDDPAHVAACFYPEIERLCMEVTGATRAFCNGHLIRKSGKKATSPINKLFTAISGPIQFVHNDFCEDYRRSVLSAFNGEDDTTATFGIVQMMKERGVTEEELSNSRLLMINTWRNVSETPLTRYPLALCDCRSVGTSELCRSCIGGGTSKYTGGASMGGDASLDFYSSLHNINHKWFWFPKMLNTEVLLIKTYDSDMKPFRPTLHSSFDDDNTDERAPERQSCEARVLCLVPKQRAKY
jgi:hypothetical protein